MVLAGVFAVGAGCNFGRVYLTRVAGQNITANLRNKVQWEVHIKGGVNILKPILRSDFILILENRTQIRRAAKKKIGRFLTKMKTRPPPPTSNRTSPPPPLSNMSNYL